MSQSRFWHDHYEDMRRYAEQLEAENRELTIDLRLARATLDEFLRATTMLLERAEIDSEGR